VKLAGKTRFFAFVGAGTSTQSSSPPVDFRFNELSLEWDTFEVVRWGFGGRKWEAGDDDHGIGSPGVAGVAGVAGGGICCEDEGGGGICCETIGFGS
jgi:hypothetical protein